MNVGCHLSISGGLHIAFSAAVELKCETFQIFTQNQRQWQQRRISQEEKQHFHSERIKSGYSGSILCAHASYLINMCAPDSTKLTKSRAALIAELERCDILNIDYLIIHPGSHGGRGEIEGIKKIAETIDSVYEISGSKVKLLLETVSGQGNSIGYRFEHLRDIIAQTSCQDKLGVCLDTCHIFAAGFPISSAEGWQDTMESIGKIIGIERVNLFHLNDSQHGLASRRDRHARIGRGMIGEASFNYLMNIPEFRKIPGILEIPGGTEAFREDLKLLKSFRQA